MDCLFLWTEGIEENEARGVDLLAGWSNTKEPIRTSPYTTSTEYGIEEDLESFSLNKTLKIDRKQPMDKDERHGQLS